MATKKTKKTPKQNLKIEFSNLRCGEEENQLEVTLTFRDCKNHRKTVVCEAANEVDPNFPHLVKVDEGRLTVPTGVEDEVVDSLFTRGHRIAISRRFKKLMVEVAANEEADPEIRRRAGLCLDPKTGKAK